MGGERAPVESGRNSGAVSYATGSHAVAPTHQALREDVHERTKCRTVRLTVRLLCGPSWQMKFQIESTHAFVLNKQTTPGPGPLEERYSGRWLEWIDSYGAAGIGEIAAAGIATIQANMSEHGITAEYIHAECQPQRFHLAEHTRPNRQSSEPASRRIGAEVDAEVCSKHVVGR